MATSLSLAPHLFVPEGALEVIGWWLTLVTASSAVAWLVDRVVRRLMPLTAMLSMTLLFPDRAPSRFKVALRNSDLGELRRRVQSAEENGGTDRDEVAGLMLSLVGALNRFDRKLRGHGERTRAYTDMLAEEMKIPAEGRDKLRWAALLHDIGKIDLPAEILAKDGPLDESERAIVRRHPLTGMRVAAPLVPWLGEWSRAIEHHHEWWDGSGYPRGLKGEEIALGARIVAVADAFDVMTAGRSYQPARSPAAARKEIAQMAGRQFDPAVARALMNVSLGRLRWMIGPVTWMGQIPFFLDRLGRDLVTVTSAAALTAATIVSSIPYPSSDVGEALAMADPAPTVVTSVPDTRPGTGSPLAPLGGAGGPGTSDTTTDSTTTTTTATTEPSGDDPSPPPGAELEEPGNPTTTTTTPTTTPPTTTAPAPSSHDDVASTEEEQAVTIDVVANDSAGMVLRSLTSSPSSGDASISSGKVRYVPQRDFNGTDTFDYQACDDAGRCDGATVAVRVTPVNDPPAARDDSASTQARQSVTIAVLDNDRDVDGDALEVGSVGSAGGGRVSTDGTRVTYSPDSGFDGTDTFTYRACDPAGACDSATVTVTVEAVPRPPNAVNDTASYHPGGKDGSVNVLTNDTHPDGLALQSVTIVTPPARGEILSVNGGTVTYRMDNQGKPVDDSFVYRVCDSRGLCDTATVTLVKGP